MCKVWTKRSYNEVPTSSKILGPSLRTQYRACKSGATRCRKRHYVKMSYVSITIVSGAEGGGESWTPCNAGKTRPGFIMIRSRLLAKPATSRSLLWTPSFTKIRNIRSGLTRDGAARWSKFSFNVSVSLITGGVVSIITTS